MLSNRARVCEALCAVSRRYDTDLEYDVQPTTHMNELGLIEGLAHEIAHILDYGRNFEDRLEDLDPEPANEREASTLRIEVVALRELGVRLSMRNLVRDAAWRGEHRFRPRYRDVHRPLDARELRCVAAFVGMVRAEMSREAAP